MNEQTRDAERTLRDYPISLRQSARAVFGSAYERAEKRAFMLSMEETAHLRPLTEGTKASD